MARTGFIHHIGTFFLFAATVLLIITDISAPVVSDISLLKVELGRNERSDLFSDDDDRFPSITFGTFGYCLKDFTAEGSKDCTDSHIGYDPVAVIERNVGDTSFSDYAHDTARALTKVMVLHPIATGLAFISFVLAIGAGFVGSFLSALGAFITFLVTAVVLITDFVSFSIVKSAVNDSNDRVVASYGSASWTTLVAAILCLFASVILLFTCCSARIHRRREARYHESKVAASSPARRRRWF
ncbi:pali-domain-containing protein [Xylaria bambusicola]|uniref:pali-domain-containing protein n=1 Tax=Xylaria bambusicola TaxID=326684 RepID=UPI00200814F8|nr:pali-domain-containing protein [Xylaria bambusicola]KAI0528244.1 pali-domain-containing protein [Xylaria bambusicola]